MWARAVALLVILPVYSLNIEMAYSEEEDEDVNSYDENDLKYSGDASTDTVILAWNHRPEMAKEIEQIKKANAALRDIFGTRILVTGAASTTSTEHVIRYKDKYRRIGATPQKSPTRTTRKTMVSYPTSLIPNFEVTERKPTRTALATVQTKNLFFKLLRITRTQNTWNTEKEIKYTTVMMESATEMTEIVETTITLGDGVDYVTVPTRNFMCSTNQLSTTKEDDRVKSLQSRTLEAEPVQTQNPGLLEVKSPQIQNPGYLSGVLSTQNKYLSTPPPLKTSLMISSKSGFDTSNPQHLRIPSINIDVRQFMWLYNYLRKLELEKLRQQQTTNQQEVLKLTSASIDDGTSGTSNQPAEPSSFQSISPLSITAISDTASTKQTERSTRTTNNTTVKIPSRRVATRHAGRTLPARRSPNDDLPSAESLSHQKIVAKCYVCGLTSKHIPEDSNCSDAFSRREFLSLEPYDPRVRMQAVRFRRYCKYYHGYPWPFEHPEVPHTIFGEFTEGCSVRWTDVAGAYTQRACRIRHNPMRGNHLASKRMAQLEYLLRHSSEGCIESPMATLLPLSRTISLFARFHACVCEGNWCNAGGQATPRMVTILMYSWFWKLLK